PLILYVIGRPGGPKAPPLGDEPVYQNGKIGLRFLAPQGWPVTSRSEIPPGPLTRTIVLVNYAQGGGTKPAEFDLIAADVPEGDDLTRFMAEYRIGSERWVARGGEAPVTVNGATATRFAMARGAGKDEYRREVTAFRRGPRVYFFVVTF